MVVGTCNPSYSGGWGRRITWTQETKVAVSWDRATALQPGWQSKTLSQQQQQRKKEAAAAETTLETNPQGLLILALSYPDFKTTTLLKKNGAAMTKYNVQTLSGAQVENNLNCLRAES